MRGRLTTIQQIAIISGLFFSFLANYLLANAAGGSTAEFWLGFQTWRWMFWVELIPAIVFFLALFAIPESPRFLVIKGRTDKANAVLTRLFGERAAGLKVAEIQQSLASDHKPKLADLLDRKGGGFIRMIVWAGIGLVRGGAGTALVGSYTAVADRIEEYHRLGFDAFILSGYPHLEEAYWFGEGVLPELARLGFVAGRNLELVERSAHAHAVNAYGRRVRVVPAAAGADAPLIGAAALHWRADLLR